MEVADLQIQPGRKEPPGGPHTWDDFVALPDDDRRELIDGNLIEVEVPTELHEYIVMALGGFLWAWVRAHKAGRVYASGYKVRVSPSRGIMPDIQFFRTGNKATREAQGVTSGAPDLAIEVISPDSKRSDRVTKLNWYAQIGAAEYWIVDPEARTLERLVLHDGTYSLAQALSDDALFTPDSFPGLEIPLGELWDSEDGANEQS